jgi:CheY-like chemotaxis protein
LSAIGQPTQPIEAFLDYFTTSHARCVLSDINLGSGLSGIELCKRLRKSGRSLKIVLMTAFDINNVAISVGHPCGSG